MTTDAQLQSGRRQLMLRDGMFFLALIAVTGVLFAVTLFLFRSFSAHRAALAQSAVAAGREALVEHRPHDAVASLRSAVSYAPNQRENELLLAQALGEEGRTEEAENYFLNLRESQPGDGFINLQLARLARQQNKQQEAVDFYHASIFGDWKGEGDVHRRNVRLELASYFTQQKEFPEAQAELLIAASNARSLAIASLDITLADALLAARDTPNALKLYQKAMMDSPRDPIAYDKAGHLAYRLGDYAHASEWLGRALRERAVNPGSTADPKGDTETLLKNSERLLLLDPDLATSRTDRVARELRNRATARHRLDTCIQQFAATSQTSAALQALVARWTASAKLTTRDAPLRDPANEDHLKALIGDTEESTARLCGNRSGDDDLLRILAHLNVYRAQPTKEITGGD